jgi:hypothetical protein
MFPVRYEMRFYKYIYTYRSDKNLEQWINFKCCVKIGESASETLAVLTLLACGEYATKKSSVFLMI